METLHINGKSLKFADRKLEEHNVNCDSHFKFHKRNFVPFETQKITYHVARNLRSKVTKRNYPEIVESKTHKRRILKRPRRFKNYYTDRKPLSISHFEFPRFGEQLLFRGRQTLCKYYKNNELMNDRLLEIKSAITLQDFEKIISDQFRANQESSKAIEPYYDTSSILAPSAKPLANETCLDTSDYYRLNYILEEKGKPQCKIFPLLSKFTSNTINNSCSTASTSIDEFIYLASECYNNCIQRYLNNLDECNQKAEKRIRRQSTDNTAIEINKSSSSQNSLLLKEDKIIENTLTTQLNKLNINLQPSCDTATTSEKIHSKYTGQSTTTIPKCRSQAMSCSDTNNNNTESTNQSGDPPKIIFSDFSTETQPKQDKSDKDLSDNRSAIDKNCLTIPFTKYSSEARPP